MEKVKDKIKEQLEKKKNKEKEKERKKDAKAIKSIIKEIKKESNKEKEIDLPVAAVKPQEKKSDKILKGRVICDRLAVRYEPSENAMLKRCEYKYQIIYLQDENKDFYKVYNEYDAYLMKKYIKILDE